MTITGAVSMAQEAAGRGCCDLPLVIALFDYQRHQADQQRPHREHVDVKHGDTPHLAGTGEQIKKRIVEQQETQQEQGRQTLPLDAWPDHGPSPESALLSAARAHGPHPAVSVAKPWCRCFSPAEKREPGYRKKKPRRSGAFVADRGGASRGETSFPVSKPARTCNALARYI